MVAYEPLRLGFKKSTDLFIFYILQPADKKGKKKVSKLARLYFYPDKIACSKILYTSLQDGRFLARLCSIPAI